MNFIEKTILQVIKHRVSKWFELERSLTKIEHINQSVELSPIKSWPDPEKIPSGDEVPFSLDNISVVGKHLKSCTEQGMKAIKSISNNPQVSPTQIKDTELQLFEKTAKELGVGAIGYCKLPAHLIFKDRAVLYNSAIVLTMEMDKEAIQKAPSLETFKMVMSTYDILGITVNRLTSKLRDMGFQAQGSHPLGGLVLYPPLAVEAGLGWFGSHGLLITPKFGARQRIAAIFINVDNLPFAKENTHGWIDHFCKTCQNCVRTCPEEAILKDPIVHLSGRRTHIERAKCLPAFVKKQGCTVCVKECLFTKTTYDVLHKQYINNSRKD